MDTLEVLVKTRELLTPEDCWTKGAYARTKTGASTLFSAPNAACFCLIGAIRKIGNDRIAITHPTCQTLEGMLPKPGIAGFNDHSETTHKDVLNLLDRAISHLTPTKD